MIRKVILPLLATTLAVGIWAGSAGSAQAQDRNLDRFYYYPYYYFPHNYWPNQGPKYPERPGAPYQKPPAYMAYPPFKEPGWRYEYFEPQRYYRGSHFWLDQF